MATETRQVQEIAEQLGQPTKRILGGFKEFRRKPLVIGAFKYLGKNPLKISSGIDGVEGEMVVHPGQYVCQGIAGELYPMNAEVFETTTTPVELGTDPEFLTKEQIQTINDIAQRCFELATAKGWHDEAEIDGVMRKASPIERFALMASEAMEALEWYRKDKKPGQVFIEMDGKPEGTAVEVIDCIIRCFDYLGLTGTDILTPGEVMELKLAYNFHQRAYRHGGKAL